MDLNDWTYEYARPIFEATQYLSDGAAQYRIRLMFWTSAEQSVKDRITEF